MFFASPARAKAGEPCYFIFVFDKGAGRFGIGEQSKTDTCAGGAGAPRCSGPQLWDKATALGVPADADRATLNRFGGGYQFSTKAGFSKHVPDDCN